MYVYMYLPSRLFVCVYYCVFVRPFLCLRVCLFVYLPVCLSLSLCSSVRSYVCMSVCLSICLFACLAAHLPVYLPVCLSLQLCLSGWPVGFIFYSITYCRSHPTTLTRSITHFPLPLPRQSNFREKPTSPAQPQKKLKKNTRRKGDLLLPLVSGNNF